MTDMPTMVTLAEEYLALRRKLGFALKGWGQKLLGFARYADNTGHRGPITVELAVWWARLPRNARPCWWARRLQIVRQFAQYRSLFDPQTEIPPADLLGRSSRRAPPHIYSDAEIAALLCAAGELGPAGGLRPHTYVTLLGLLLTTGLRISEALRLDRNDVDLHSGVLTVRRTKFRKSRLVPLHPSTVTALAKYARRRGRHFPQVSALTFFLNELGAPLSTSGVAKTFGALRCKLGWTKDRDGRRPRLHDMRHTMAVRTLLRWYREGGDVDRKMPALSTYLGHVEVRDTYWYLTAVPELMALTAARFEAYQRRGLGEDAMNAPSDPKASPGFPSLLQEFFCQRLITQRNVTARTVAAYRDTFRLLLRYIESRLRRSPVAITLADLDAPLILGFLDHLEHERGNCARTRNLRLVAIRSFLRYAAYREPIALPTVQRVLAIPMKRFDRPLLGFLSHPEMQAILQAPDRTTWSGQRDHVMLTTMYNTGARVSEAIALCVGDLDLDQGTSVRIRGKGRKERLTPLWRSTAKLLREWLKRGSRDPVAPLFPNRYGRPLSRSGLEQRLRTVVTLAEERCPSLRGRRISPHTVRHTTAMHLLQAGVDLTVIALWLGHESPATTHQYIEADLAMKERALQSLQEPSAPRQRFRATDRLLAFLDSL